MRVVTVEEVTGTSREVYCPSAADCISFRLLLKSEGMGFSVNKTVVPKGGVQHWHYLNHLEACYCIAGHGILTDLKTGETHHIWPDTVYALDDHDDHTFQAVEDVVLISIFNPPLKGRETHNPFGSYGEREGS